MYAFALNPFGQTTRDFQGPVTAFRTSGLSRIESRISRILAGRSPFSSFSSLAIGPPSKNLLRRPRRLKPAPGLRFLAENFGGFRHALKLFICDVGCVHA